MKRIFLSFLLLLLYAQGYSFASKTECLSVHVKLVGVRSAAVQLNCNRIVYNIEIEIKNKCDSTLRFWMWDCSWQDSFLCQDSRARFWYHDCLFNPGIIKTLESGEKIIFRGEIEVELDTNIKHNNKMRVGFVFIDGSSSVSGGLYLAIKKMKEDRKCIVWSNEIRLKKVHHKIASS